MPRVKKMIQSEAAEIDEAEDEANLDAGLDQSRKKTMGGTW